MFARIMFLLVIHVIATSAVSPLYAQLRPLTPAQLEGPYYCPNPPLKPDFRVDATGNDWVSLHLAGRVMNREGHPVPGVKVDFWHTNQHGEYDETCVPPVDPVASYRLRGYVETDENGRYELWTVLPGLYPGRTRHLHAKVFHAPSSATELINTQLYFPDPYSWDGNFDGAPDVPGAPSLVTDGLFRNDFARFGALVMTITNDPRTADQWDTTLDFVVTATVPPPPTPGDLDRSGGVDRHDLARFVDHLGKPNGATWSSGDFNFDGRATLADLRLLQANLATPGSSAATTAVSEPAAWFVGLLAGGAAIVAVRKRDAAQRAEIHGESETADAPQREVSSGWPGLLGVGQMTSAVPG